MNKAVAKRWKQYHDAKEPFRKIFGIELDDYMDMTTPEGIIAGFDLVQFDDFIVPKLGQSMKDAISDKYGEEAVKLIESLF